MRHPWILLTVLAAACGGATGTTGPLAPPADTPTTEPVPAPAPTPEDDGLREGADSTYIVSYRTGASVAARALPGATVLHAYRNTGAVEMRMSPERARALAQQPQVEYVEGDVEVGIDEGTFDGAHRSLRSGVLWGLDRINQRGRPLDGSVAAFGTGSGVDVYVFDTGVIPNHQEFGDRVTLGFSGFTGTATDCNGHGTHVAGTVGGSTVGIARQARLVSVRVLGCNGRGTATAISRGIEWMLQRRAANPAVPAVANMSLGLGSASQALDDQIGTVVAAGILNVAAAGNSAVNACGSSPGRSPFSLTVGASGDQDEQTSFSNWGECVHLFAPGAGITSAMHTGPAAYAPKNGTSMAAPHVAGAAAVLLGAHPGASPDQLRAMLLASATPDALTGLRGASPNRLLFLPASAPDLPTVAPAVVGTRLTPASVNLFGNETRQFFLDEVLSNGTRRAAAGATWTASAGSITSDGLFTAPNTSGTVTITGSAGGRTQTARVTVTGVTALEILPNVTQVMRGQARQFQLRLVTTANRRVVVPEAAWEDHAGQMGAQNRFTAGEALGTVTIRARHSSGLTATAAVTVVDRINAAPVARITASCRSGRQCTFNAGSSTDDLAVDQLTVAWLVNNQPQRSGTWAQERVYIHTFPGPGTYTITLRVTDAQGAVGTAAVTARVP